MSLIASAIGALGGVGSAVASGVGALGSGLSAGVGALGSGLAGLGSSALGGLGSLAGGVGSALGRIPLIGGSLNSLIGGGLGGGLSSLAGGNIGGALGSLGSGLMGAGTNLFGQGTLGGGLYGGADKLFGGLLPNFGGVLPGVSPSNGWLGSLYGGADKMLGGYLPGGMPAGTTQGVDANGFPISIMPGENGGMPGDAWWNGGKAAGGGLEGILGTVSKVGNLLGGLKGVAGGGQMATTPAAVQHAANAGQPKPIVLGGGPAGSVKYDVLNATTPGGLAGLNASRGFGGASIPQASDQDAAREVLAQLIGHGQEGGLGGLGAIEASLDRSGLGAPGRLEHDQHSHA